MSGEREDGVQMWSSELQRLPWCEAEGEARLQQSAASREESALTLLCAPPSKNNPPSDDKGRKMKRRGHGRRKKKVVLAKEREDECFSCGDGGQMVSCKKPGCPKVYHADCLNLTKRPAG